MTSLTLVFVRQKANLISCVFFFVHLCRSTSYQQNQSATGENQHEFLSESVNQNLRYWMESSSVGRMDLHILRPSIRENNRTSKVEEEDPSPRGLKWTCNQFSSFTLIVASLHHSADGKSEFCASLCVSGRVSLGKRCPPGGRVELRAATMFARPGVEEREAPSV